jgi:hypothetical protein
MEINDKQAQCYKVLFNPNDLVMFQTRIDQRHPLIFEAKKNFSKQISIFGSKLYKKRRKKKK